MGRDRDHVGRLERSRGRRSAASATSPASTSSSSGAAPPTSRPGSRDAGRDRSASTSPRRSSPPPARCQAEPGIVFPLIEASAEDVPLPSESFDLAVSEYGASIWCDPHRWIPEAHRLLRPGGRLVVPPQQHALDSLLTRRRPAGPRRFSGRSAGSVASSGRARSASSGSSRTASCSAFSARPGFDVVDLVELYPPRTPSTTSTTTRSRSNGRGSGRPRRSGSRSEARVTVATRSRSRRPRRSAARSSSSSAIPFAAVAPAYIEHDPPDADPVVLGSEHAEGKARSVHRDGAVTLGVDTTVHLDGRVYGKPDDRGGAGRCCASSPADPRRRLRALPARRRVRRRRARGHTR